MVKSLLTLVVLLQAACHLASAGPWDLRDYERCEFLRLTNITEMSGVTYSAETGTVWTVTREPMMFSEYSLPKGTLLRGVPAGNLDLRDPEGITWMYDYTFAVAEEESPVSRRESMITIFTIKPWWDKATVIRKLIVPIDQGRNQGLEGLTWDPLKQVLVAGQEKPMKAWQIDPKTGKYKYILQDAERSKHNLWDFAGVYKRAGDPGLFVLSEPTQLIFHLDENGEETGGQVMKLEDARMPEGLTFTPDGALMIVVGEPNQMFIYSSTGSCKWSPSSTAMADVSPTTKSKFPWPFSSPPSSADLDANPTQKNPGFCSWTQCGSGAVNIPWCSADIDTCVSSCNGWWCSDTIGVPPITEEIWEVLSAPAPWYKDDSLGYCSAYSPESDTPWCGGGGGAESANPWCRKSMENCLACKGAWCPKPSVEGDVQPITLSNSPTPDSANISASAAVEWFEDPSQGYCNYNGCDRVPKGEPWCLKSQSNCNSCQGTWCPQGSLPFRVAPIPPPGKTGQDSPEDDPKGYQALVSLLLRGAPDPELIGNLREAAAASAYGAEDAVVSVAVLDSAQEAATRRLQEETALPQPHVVLVLNGDTAHHAAILAQRLERDVKSGRLRDRAQARTGGVDVGDITLEHSIIKSAGVSPQEFPVGPAVVLEEVPVIILKPQDWACLSSPAVLAAIVCAACALLAGIICAVVFIFVRSSRKPSACTGAESTSTGASTEPPSKSVAVQAPAALASHKGSINQKPAAIEKLPL